MDIPLVVPVYKPVLESNEVVRLGINRLMNPLVIFVLPKSIQEVFVKHYKVKDRVIAFPDEWFNSRKSYSKFLLTPLLWSQLRKYEKVLICQTDALLIRPPQELQQLTYSFVGAPWIKRKNCFIFRNQLFVDYKKLYFLRKTKVAVGNGGLSLRNPSHTLEVLKRAKEIRQLVESFDGRVNEDIVFSFLFTKFNYIMPDEKTALTFFMEEHASELVNIPDVYGFHALERFNPNLERQIFNSFLPFLDNS